MSIKSTIEGIDELDSFLKDHPKELDKTVIGCLTKGSAIIKKEIISLMPDALKKLKPIVTSKNLTKSSNPNVLIGVFGRKMFYINKRGVRWDAFNLAYWSNFGTMANRDKSHVFQTSRRKVSKNFKGGIRPTNFFDRAVNNTMDSALNSASDSLNKIVDDLANKYGFH